MNRPSLPALTQPDVIIRHPRERRRKCTLSPLRHLPELTFINASPSLRFDASGFILLAPDAPPLSPRDPPLPLLLLDSTWQLLPSLNANLIGCPLPRSLPANIRTAYPRISKITTDPATGLASVEALFAARFLLNRPCLHLLRHYHWRLTFLAQFFSRWPA